MLALFISLLLAHILGDFILQPQKWVKHKEKHTYKSIFLYLHIGVHLACTSLVLLTTPIYLWLIIPIGITHYLIDLAKLRFRNKKNKVLLFFIDQALHILVLALLTLQYNAPKLDWTVLDMEPILLLATFILLSTVVSAVLMRTVLQNWDKDITKENKKKSLKGAGNYIGVLERLFVFTFVVLGHWSAIGFLIAAKSAFRFGDLSEAKNRKLTEYMLIGTLLSFGLALLFGILYLQISKLY
jgi:energy-converting hydrogenase Eha subunit E